MNYLRLALFNIFFIFSQYCFSQIVTLSDLYKNTPIKNQVTYLEDKKDIYQISEVQQSKAFQQVKNDVPNFGVTNKAYWLKLKIHNVTDRETFLLQVSQPGLDEINIYHTDQNGKLTYAQAGEHLTFSHREFFDPNYIFRVFLPKGDTSEIYLKVKARDNIQVPIIIGTVETIFESNKVKDTLAGIYLGIMFVMFFYNAFLWLTVKDKIYLLYIIYLAAVILTQASIQGYTFQYLWPGIPVLEGYSSFIFPPLVGITSILFFRGFLHSQSYYPKLDKGLFIFIALYIVAFLISLTGSFKLSFTLIEICASIVSMYMLFMAYLIHKKGYRPARYFLLAWSFFLVGVTIYVMKDVGVLPYNDFTYYTMPVGSAIEVVLLSFALADRINILKVEKEASQAEVLTLITEQNIILEQKVALRTEELEHKNIELGQTLTDLKETQTQLVNAEKMASLGQLTAGIAHEINNPINFVSANVKPLQMDIADILEVIEKYEQITPDTNYLEQLKEIEAFKKQIDLNYVREEIDSLLHGIEDGAKRTAEIVKGLKNFSRLDESDIKEADLNEGISSTLVLLKNILSDNIDVVKDLGDIPQIECYPGKLNQVFMNVLSNSIQAIQQKPIKERNTLTIKSYVSGENVCVSIEDTGIGMAPEVIAKVFEPFFTTKDVGEGTGLGMSIVFKIIESHNGSIDIDSEVGKGTRVTITLPLKLSQPG